jgi:hypothetical protein
VNSTDPVAYLQKTAKVKDECAKIYFKLGDSAAVEGQALNAEDDEFLSGATNLDYIDDFSWVYTPNSALVLHQKEPLIGPSPQWIEPRKGPPIATRMDSQQGQGLIGW